MVKFVRIFKNYYLGISFCGIIAFVIQEIPYMVMPFIKLASNPIMNMQNEIPWIEKTQGLVGVLSMLLLMLIVRDDIAFFSVKAKKEKAFFFCAVLMILINFAGWAFYFSGFQHTRMIVISQFAAVPLYYLFFGLWKRNYLLVGTASLFFVIHTVNGCLNFMLF